MNEIWKRTANQLSNPTREKVLRSNILYLCKLGRLKEALKVLDSRPSSFDSSLYSSVLQTCIDKKAGKEGWLLHDHLLRTGFDLDSHLNTKLIIFFAKIGDVDVARYIFDKMPDRSIVSWTAMISGYSQNRYFKEALLLFLAMHRSGFKANEFTYGSILKSCTSLMCLQRGKQLQGLIVKTRFSENLFVRSALVDLHSKCGRIEDAWYLFEGMGERDIVCWNALIGGYAGQGLADDTFGIFCSMLREGIMPDHFTFGSILQACVRVKAFVQVKQIHGFIIKLGFESHHIVNGSLINAYSKCGSVRNAGFLYKCMPEKDLISCTALITAYAHEGRNIKDALDLFVGINHIMVVDNVVLCSMINICAKIASLCLGRQIHALALKKQSNCDTAMCNALIDMYCKSGEVEDATSIFEEMEEKNVISWTSLIGGYGKHGFGQKAIVLFEKMEDNGLKPNDVTFLSLLFACSHSGLTSEGLRWFNCMISKYNIRPRAEHYSCMVDLFARQGQLEEAFDLIMKMNVKPNASIWGAILGACNIYGDISLGERVSRHVFNLDPENSINYVVLASIYASAGLWEDAWKTRKLMEDKGLTKHLGFSLA